MEETLKNALDTDETVLWTGKPEAFETLDTTHKRYFIVGTLISFAIIALLIIAYVSYTSNTRAELKPGVVALLAVVAFIFPLSVIFDARKLRKNIMYAATNKRLITVRDSVSSANYDTIRMAEFRTDSDGHVCLLCGEDALGFRPARWRSAALFSRIEFKDNGDEVCDSFAFYAIPDSNKLKSAVSAYLPVS